MNNSFDEGYKKWKEEQQNSETKVSFEAGYSNWLLQNRKGGAESFSKEIENRVNTWLQNNNNFISNAQYRAQSKGGYVADSGEWLSTITTQKNNFDREAESIKNLLDQHKDVLDPRWVHSINSLFDENGKTQADIVAGFTEENSYWNQWENEEAYNEWYAWEQKQKFLLHLDVDEAKKQAETLETTFKQGEDLQYKRAELVNLKNRVESDIQYKANAGWDVTHDKGLLAEYESQIAELDSQMNELGDWQGLKEKAANLREDATYATYKQMGKQLKEEALSAPDFETNNKYGTEVGGWVLGEKDYIKNWIGQMTEHFGEFYDAMTEEEKKILGYYLANNDDGKMSKASDYLYSIEEDVNARIKFGIVEEKDTAFEKLLFSVSAGLDQFGSGMSGLLNAVIGEDRYQPSSATQMASQEIRQNISDSDGFWNGVLGVAYDFGSTTANMLPSILVGMVNPVAGTALMGASAGGNAYNEMINLGYDKNQARAYGVMVGASEALLEKALGGMSAFGGGGAKLTTKMLSKVDNAFARWAIQTGGSMISEFGEEALQTILEPWFKSIVTGADYDAPDIDEILYSGLLGALSAGVLEGGGNAINSGVTTYRGSKVKKTDGAVEKLKKLGTSFSADSVASQLAGRVTNESGAYTIGRLFQEVGATLSAQNKSDIIIGLTKRGVDESSAKKIADTYEAFLNGEMELTDTQVKTLEGLDPLADVLRKNIIGVNTDVYQRTREYSDILDLISNKETKTDTPSAPEVETPKAPQAFAPYSKEYIDNKAKEFEAMGLPIAEAQALAQSNLFAPTQDNVAPTKENAVESKYEVSAEGKTINTKSGEVVKINKIESISSNGEANLTIDDGMVVKASDLSFGTDAEALFVENIGAIKIGKKPISTTSANALYMTAMSALQSNPNMTADEAMSLIKGLEESYVYGTYNLGRSKLTARNEDGSTRLYAGELSQAQRKYAYELGTKDAVSKTEADQKAIDDLKAKAEGKTTQKKLGKVIFEKGANVDESALTDTQRANLNGIKLLAQISSVEFHIFRSDKNNNFKYTMPDGTVTTANGWFVAGTNQIWIDLNAGNFGEGTMVRTAAHEISHYIKQWSPQKWNAMADLLMEEFAKNGVDTESMRNKQVAKIKKRYNKNNMPSESVLLDMAYEELVCDALSDMLTDGSIVNFIAEVKAKDASLGKKIINAIKNLLKKWGLIIDDYKGRSLDTAEAQALSQFEDTFKKLQEMYRDAFMDANETVAALDGIANVDADTESVSPMLSERTWTESEYVTKREEAAKEIAEALGVSVKKATQYIDDINSIAKMIAEARIRLDYEASPFGSAFVSNVEYGGSFDFTTLCKKRRLFTGTFSAIQKALRNTALTPDDILKIRNMMIERGLEATCGLCYVEGSRANMGQFAKEFIRLYKRDNPNAWIPDMADVNTPDGVESMKINHPKAYEQYEYFWNHYGKLQDSDPALFASQQKPKLYEARKEYKNEILKLFKKGDTVTQKNRNGGIRMQSFSDFEIVHLIDTMQIIMDMSRVGLAGQAYTKVPEFAKAFGNTGLKINLSLIAKGVDADGKLIFDDREGMPHETAFDLRNQYSANVGTIIVTFTDEQLMAAMADDRIDYIIPFHRSQWKKGQYNAMGLPKGTKDYTFMQNEKLIKQTYHEYRGRQVKDKATNYMPNEYWDFSKSGKENAEAYLKMCAENNKRPKFYKLLDYDGKGTYSLKKDGSTDGYWKLLIDFKMYDNNGKGSPQNAVVPNFNMEESTKMLDEYKGGHQSYPVAYDVVDAFVEEYTAGKDKMHFSERDSEGNTLSEGQQKFFKNSKVRDKDGNLMVVYHGTPNKFTTFRQGVAEGWGKGIYFTDNVVEAKNYGDNIVKAYLNITNPFNADTMNYDKIGAENTKAYRDFDMKKWKTWWSFEYDTYEEYVDDGMGVDMYEIYTEEVEVFNKILRELGYDGIIAHGSNNVDGFEIVAFDESQPKLTTNTNPTADPDIRYSLRDVDPVEPTSNKWQRTLTTSEVKAKFPDLWDVSADESEVRNPTQISGTVRSYRKVYDFLKKTNFKGTILDASSGLGYGTKAGIEEYGFDVEDIEPYPDKSYSPKYTDYSSLDKKYDVIISNAVLNVLPQDQRDALVVKMGELLKDGGRMFVNVRGDDVRNASSKVAINESLMEYYISKSGSYQKGFTKSELVAYLQDALGDGFSVTPTTFFGKTSAVVTKNEGQVIFSERDTDSSNRGILANALESVAENDVEKNKLAQYKEKIALIEAEEQRLSEIQKQLFTKGAVEPTERKALQFEAKQISNRINTYDRQLLNLESTTALKNVLNREKALAMKRQKQKDTEYLKQYKEKVAKTQRELLERNQESRKKAIEGREKTAMRHKIKGVVNDLNNLLLKPSKERHVPEEMRIAVAEALSIVNMDTVDADTRVAHYNDLIAKATDPDVIASLTETRDRILNQGNKLADKLTKLKDAYSMVRDSADESLRSMYDDVIYGRIESVQKIVGKTPLRNMTLGQLESVYDLYKMVLTTIRDSNKAFAENITQTRLALGSNTFAEIKEGHKTRDTIKHQHLEKFLWQNLKPMQAMKTIGSGTLQKLWNNILYGQETFAVDYNEAVNFAKEMKDKHGYKEWNKDKLYSFESKSGKVMKLNLEQMMSIYAYSKRAQADEHIEYGGIVLNEGVIKVKNKLGKTVEVKVNDSTAYRLDKMQVASIVATLDKVAPGAKAFVDEMQKYLSETMGAKGNEVSMKMYGVKLFKEEHYFPLKSSKDFMEAANAKLKGDVKIKNKGMTKSTVEHARNPIVLENFLDVWGNHINEMALYHGLVLPLEDFSRTLNYSFKADDRLNTDAESVRTALHDAFGDNADNYLNELLKAINGGVLHDSTAGFADRMISKFKKAKVMASLSVIVQQPTAIIRAMGIIEPKYFVAQNFSHKATWEELKKYCPTAIIKETGSFDTNMGRTIVDMIKDERGFTEKVGDVLGKAPAYMDEMGWNMIWRALKKKVATEQNLSGEALLQECGKQMTLIINETQVYDSVMSRNELMRSKSAFTKMATSFMAEPATVANMIYGAGLDFKRGYKGKAGKAVAATIASVVINSLVSAIVYAMRDDDEEKTFLEKYISSATTEVVDGLNPLTYIPFVKDAYSIFQGYDVERTDMALIGDVVDAINSFYDVLDPEEYEGLSEKETAKHIYENSVPLLTAICDMFGLPVGNVLRDAKAIIVRDDVSMSQSSAKGIGDAFKEGIMSSLPEIVSKIVGTESKQDQLYDAIVSGDDTTIERLKSGYKDEASYETAVRKALRENDERIKEAAEAYNDGDIRERDRILAEIVAEGFFDEELVASAIKAEASALDADTKEESEEEDEEKATSIYKADDINVALANGDNELALEIIDDLVKTKVENGMEEDKARSSVKSSVTSYWKPLYKAAYQNKDAEEMKRIRFILADTGLYGRASEVVETCREWAKELSKDKNK